MYGNVDYYVAQELAKMIAKWRNDNMDPMTVNRIALSRQQEILEETARDRNAKSMLRPLQRQLGRWLIVLGQRMAQADCLEAQPADTPIEQTS